MAPKYRLHYFNAMAVAEPIRLIFAYAKVDYEDVRVEKEDWPKLKPSMPWGQLPVLEIDGVPLAQSTAICRYLANKYGMAGDTEMETAKCDEYVGVVTDMRTESSKFFYEKDETKKSALAKQLEEETLPKYLDKFTAILEKQGNCHLVGSKLSYADILLAYTIETTGKHFAPKVLDRFPVIKKFVDSVMNKPGIKEWIAKRPQTQF